MIETGVVLNGNMEPIFWHLPEGRHGGALPDSVALWNVIWENRDNLWGVAHTHPGSGVPGPSYTDVTTFAAVEAGLGKQLYWPIISSTDMVVCVWHGPGKLSYVRTPSIDFATPEWQPHLSWVNELRRLSNM